MGAVVGEGAIDGELGGSAVDEHVGGAADEDEAGVGEPYVELASVSPPRPRSRAMSPSSSISEACG